MKTFLWTSLFWIILAIAGLLCLWFGNLWTQVLDNGRLASFLPGNVQTKACDPIVTSTLENIDWCEKAQEAECNLVTAVETWDLQWIQESIDAISSNQIKMYEDMKNAFDSMEKKMLWLSYSESVPGEDNMESQLIEKREQQKRELQAQIEALQNEMANL